MIIEFRNVGRNKANWSIESENIDYDLMYKEVKKHLMSDIIDFAMVEGDDDCFEGSIIVGGFRAVGSFKVTK